MFVQVNLQTASIEIGQQLKRPQAVEVNSFHSHLDEDKHICKILHDATSRNPQKGGQTPVKKFMSVMDDAQFLPTTPDPHYPLTFDAHYYTSSASADPFQVDWPHWNAPVPPWLVRAWPVHGRV